MATALPKQDRRLTQIERVMNSDQEMAVQVEMRTTDAPPTSQAMVTLNKRTVGAERKQVRTVGVTNSSRWTDDETRNLLEVWGARYSSLRFKKRNFKDWEIISKEFNKKCQVFGVEGLGPRTGAQCKIRIKNIIADYKRMKGQYAGQNSRQLFPFFGTIDNIIGNSKQEASTSFQTSEDYSGEEVKPEEIVHLDLPAGVIEPTITEVNIANPTVTVPNSSISVAVNSATMIQRQSPSLSSNMVMSTFSTTPFHVNRSVTVNNASLTSPQTSSIHTLQFNNTSLEPHKVPNYESSTFTHRKSQLDTSNLPSPSYASSLQKKNLRKNPRPAKIVKVTRKANEDDKLLAIVREFMEERRKREEELFDKLFQQQAEAEKRYQEFTLNVIKEIGRLFRPEAAN